MSKSQLVEAWDELLIAMAITMTTFLLFFFFSLFFGKIPSKVFITYKQKASKFTEKDSSDISSDTDRAIKSNITNEETQVHY